MHPAVSIILFTTLSGAGLGLGFWIGVGVFAAAESEAAAAAALSIVLAGGGLMASVFHLRRPDRAWRALSQWRSSWLSREGILAPAALGLVFLYAVVLWFEGIAVAALGYLAAAASLGAVYATGMIYAQLRAVPAWRGGATAALFLSLAAAGGAVAAAAVRAVAGRADPALAAAALGLILVAWGLQLYWWRRLDRIGAGDSTIATATGLTERGPVRLLEPPHTGGNYLMSEMGFAVARRRASALRRIALAVGGILPAALLGVALAADAAWATLLAALAHLAGVGAARWLFFAEAKHVVTLYYGDRPGA